MKALEQEAVKEIKAQAPFGRSTTLGQHQADNRDQENNKGIHDTAQADTTIEHGSTSKKVLSQERNQMGISEYGWNESRAATRKGFPLSVGMAEVEGVSMFSTNQEGAYFSEGSWTGEIS